MNYRYRLNWRGKLILQVKMIEGQGYNGHPIWGWRDATIKDFTMKGIAQ